MTYVTSCLDLYTLQTIGLVYVSDLASLLDSMCAFTYVLST